MSQCVFDDDKVCKNKNFENNYEHRCIEADNLLKNEQTLCRYRIVKPKNAMSNNKVCLYLFNEKCARGLCSAWNKSCVQNSGESCAFYIPEHKFIEMKKQEVAQTDNVRHPSHYVDGRKYEPKDVIRDWNLNFNLGSAVKYISRAGRKDDIIQDLKKAKQFIDFEIEALERESQTFS